MSQIAKITIFEDFGHIPGNDHGDSMVVEVKF